MIYIFIYSSFYFDVIHIDVFKMLIEIYKQRTELFRCLQGFLMFNTIPHNILLNPLAPLTILGSTDESILVLKESDYDILAKPEKS